MEKLPKDIVSYGRGLGNEVWKNVDVEEYVKSLRKEWVKRGSF